MIILNHMKLRFRLWKIKMDIIKIKDGRYDIYEKLLFERDNIRKEAERYRMCYIDAFGEKINKLFEKKVDCIILKQKIAFCQAAANKGEMIKLDELKEFTENIKEEYSEQLRKMALEYEEIQNSKTISEEEVQKIKKIYHQIARLIHPDINPDTEDNPIFKDLWQRVVAAYTYNDFKEIQELEIIVKSALKQLGSETIEIVVPDISDKIADLEREINEIISTDPYRYKFLLDDELMVQEKFNELDREYLEYSHYESELRNILKKFIANGVIL